MVAMLTGLPPDSALYRAVIGDAWTNETALLALIADRLGVIATDKMALQSLPDPVPRPAGLREAKVVTDPDSIAAFFGGGVA